MYVMALEAAAQYAAFASENISDVLEKKKQYTFLVLQYMQGCCCQEFWEILHSKNLVLQIVLMPDGVQCMNYAVMHRPFGARHNNTP